MHFSDSDFESVSSVDDFSQKTILINSTENIIKLLDPFLGLLGRLLSRDLIITTYDTEIPTNFMYKKESVDSNEFRLKNDHRFMNFMKSNKTLKLMDFRSLRISSTPELGEMVHAKKSYRYLTREETHNKKTQRNARLANIITLGLAISSLALSIFFSQEQISSSNKAQSSYEKELSSINSKLIEIHSGLEFIIKTIDGKNFSPTIEENSVVVESSDEKKGQAENKD